MALVELQELKNQSVKIILNDPQNLNAMSESMADEFLALVNKLKTREGELRAIVLSGAGRAFSAGGDLSMLEAKTQLKAPENKRRMLNFYNSFLSLLGINVPLIAALNGHAVGAGLCLASACDIRICTQDAKLGFSFTKLGLHPGMGATFFLPRLLGDSLAREMLFSGRIIEASEALKIKLVSKIVETSALDAECEKLISEFSVCGPRAVSMLTETLRSYNSLELNNALLREAECQAQSYSSDEFKEGVRAAIEKRKAKFSLS